MRGELRTPIWSLSLALCLLFLTNVNSAPYPPWVMMDEAGHPVLINTEPTTNYTIGSVEDIRFLLYTRNSPDVAKEINIDNLDSISDMPNVGTKFMVHGFSATPFGMSFPWGLRAEYLRDEMTEDYHIILLDYSKLVAAPDFFAAFRNAQIAAEHSAKLLKVLVDNGKTSWDQIHLLGHSLGGQVVGQIGNRAQTMEGGGTIGRITSLDPAKPLFDYAHEDNRTTPDDATFVDVIHTASNGIVAWLEPIGHVDWYPNGGGYQTGCDLEWGCSHERAAAVYVESVFSPKGFWGRNCPTYDEFKNGTCNGAEQEVMGEHTPHSARGVYFLDTEPKSPFAKGPL